MPLREIIYLQLLVLVFAASDLLTKVTGNALKLHGVFSFATLLPLFAALLLLACYAFFWQRVLSRLDLSLAYLSKSTSIFWSMLASHFLFHENLTWKNCLGVALIFSGVVLINVCAPPPTEYGDDFEVGGHD